MRPEGAAVAAELVFCEGRQNKDRRLSLLKGQTTPMIPSDERITPSWLWEPLHAEFGFSIDAAASATNAKTFHYCGLDPVTELPEATLASYSGEPGRNIQAHFQARFCHGDGLKLSWMNLAATIGRRPSIWLNPPYSRGSILKWCEKAQQESLAGCTVVLLLPADTSTEYFHRYALRHECRYLNRRLSFEGAPRDKKGRLAPAKFGSVLVVMRRAHPMWSWR